MILSKNRWQEWVNMALGLWLFVSPFFGYGHAGSMAAWNAHVVGAVIVLLSASARLFSQIWEEWINMALGIWLFAAPFVLGFHLMYHVMLNQMDVGAALFGISLWAAIVHPPYEGSGDVEHALHI